MEDVVRLEVVEDGQKQYFELQEEDNLIGSDQDLCDISLDGLKISHCSIYFERGNEELKLVKLEKGAQVHYKGKNGEWLELQFKQGYQLRVGEEFRIGERYYCRVIDQKTFESMKVPQQDKQEQYVGTLVLQDIVPQTLVLDDQIPQTLVLQDNNSNLDEQVYYRYFKQQDKGRQKQIMLQLVEEYARDNQEIDQFDFLLSRLRQIEDQRKKYQIKSGDEYNIQSTDQIAKQLIQQTLVLDDRPIPQTIQLSEQIQQTVQAEGILQQTMQVEDRVIAQTMQLEEVNFQSRDQSMKMQYMEVEQDQMSRSNIYQSKDEEQRQKQLDIKRKREQNRSKYTVEIKECKNLDDLFGGAVEEVEKKEEVSNQEKQQQELSNSFNNNMKLGDGKQNLKKSFFRIVEDLKNTQILKTGQQDQEIISKKSKNEQDKANSVNEVIVEEIQTTEQNQIKQKKKNEQNKLILGSTIKEIEKNQKKIQFSGIKQVDEFQKIKLRSIGGLILENESLDFDILVLKQAKKTYKLLISLLRNIPIVNEKWVEDSIAKKKLLKQYDQYCPESSDDFVNQNGDTLYNLIQKRKMEGDEYQIFEKCKFWVSEKAEPSCEELKSLIAEGGGQIIEKRPKKTDFKGNSKIYCILGVKSIDDFNFLQETKAIILESESILKSILLSEWDYQSYLIDESFFIQN